MPPVGTVPTNVTITDVARLAGVSTTTVCHALGGQRPVSAPTREKVLDAVRSLGYRPHPGARSLKTAASGVLALCVTNVTGGALPLADMEYYVRVVNAATQAALEEGLALVVVPESTAGLYWDRLLLDGAIVVDPVAGDPAVRALEARGLPLVTVGRRPEAPDEGHWVDNDPAAATRLSLDHLAARGAADVAAVTWITTDHWTQECVRAYHAWCRERGHKPRLQVVARDDDEALRSAAERLLTTGRRPDAVWSLAELPALWVLRVAAESGVRVPEDVMVAGTSDFGLGATSVLPLTCIDYHAAELGREAARLLIDLVRGRTPAAAGVVVPATLIERLSTAR
jgi:DNA-binding LacI/PurR family transcriptional regulator